MVRPEEDEGESRLPQYHRRREGWSRESSGRRRDRHHHHRSRRRRRSRSPSDRRRSRSPTDRRDRSRSGSARKVRRGVERRSRSRSLSWSPPPAVRRQMAEAKARREREAKQGNVKSGKFWDGFRWVEHTPASQMPSNPATRRERRLYVGNLPLTFDSDQLRVFLNEALKACGAVPKGTDQVVVSSWVSPDKKFAFVELSTVEAATTALGLSGITCLGSQLKITYPNNYQMATAPGGGLLPGLANILQGTAENQTANATLVAQNPELVAAALAAINGASLNQSAGGGFGRGGA